MSDKERLVMVMNHYNMNANAFSRFIGLRVVQTLYDIIKDRHGISKDLAGKITSKCLDINISWLLTGEGEMLKPGAKVQSSVGIVSEKNTQYCKSSAHTVPLFPLSAYGGKISEFAMEVNRYDCEMIISPIKGAELAVTVTGDSMADEYPNGSIVLVKKIDERAFIEPGKVYVVDTVNGVVIKIVTKTKEGTILCTSINKDQERYSPFEIPSEYVFGMYIVLMCISEK